MKRDPNSHRSQIWMKRNDFTTNQQCRAFLIKLFDIFHIKYEFKASSILVWYSDREHYRVILDPEKVLVKLINKRTGAVKEYWKPEPYYDMCMDIVQSEIKI